MSISKQITLIIWAVILGAVAMYFWRENEIKPLKDFSDCLNEKTSYFDAEPYLSLDDLRNCYKRHLIEP